MFCWESQISFETHAVVVAAAVVVIACTHFTRTENSTQTHIRSIFSLFSGFQTRIATHTVCLSLQVLHIKLNIPTTIYDMVILIQAFHWIFFYWYLMGFLPKDSFPIFFVSIRLHLLIWIRLPSHGSFFFLCFFFSRVLLAGDLHLKRMHDLYVIYVDLEYAILQWRYMV